MAIASIRSQLLIPISQCDRYIEDLHDAAEFRKPPKPSPRSIGKESILPPKLETLNKAPTGFSIFCRDLPSSLLDLLSLLARVGFLTTPNQLTDHAIDPVVRHACPLHILDANGRYP